MNKRVTFKQFVDTAAGWGEWRLGLYGEVRASDGYTCPVAALAYGGGLCGWDAAAEDLGVGVDVIRRVVEAADNNGPKGNADRAYMLKAFGLGGLPDIRSAQ